MKKTERKMDNKGFSLILVIICMTFIGVLATMILSVAVNNVQMRVVEQESSDNFYSAEEVLDEVRANVEKQANIALGDAYTLFLQKYALTAPKMREQVFIDSLTDVLKNLFQKDFVDAFASTAEEDAFNSKYLGIATGATGVSFGRAEGMEVDDSNSDYSTITLQGVKVTYTDEEGNSTTIKTDLVVKVTYPKFFEDNVAGPAFLDYAIISDGNVEKNTGGDATVSTIRGCVYSGNDLIVSDGANLAVQAPYVIVKNTIDVKNNSTLSIDKGLGVGGLKYASTSKAGLWTQNIVTTPLNRTQTSGNSLFISGMNSYVQDDLTINGIADAVTVTGGNYYGYGSGLTGEADTNSAVNINAIDTHLEIKNLSHLWLAGQSFISVPEGYGNDVTEEVKLSVMQGESVSFKGNQAAYLMPGDSIEGVWHNPMTREEYDAALNAQGSLVISTRKADSISGDIMNLDQYLDVSSNASGGDYTSRYKPVFVKYQQGGEMVYIYMTFSTPNAAKKYFEEYYSINKDLVDTRMETIGSGSILIEDISEITATGNLVVRSADGSNPNTVIHSNAVATNSQVREADYAYSGNFRSLTLTLDASAAYFGSGSDLTDCLFRFEKLTTLPTVETTHDSNLYKLYVSAASTYETVAGQNYGLIIADGDVVVKQSFTGLIIAKGTVTVADGVTITSAPEAMNALITSNDELKSFFKYYDDPNAGEESKEAVDIFFENWQKN